MADHAFSVRASYLEVGQEEIRDLLNYEAISYHLDVQYDAQVSRVTGQVRRVLGSYLRSGRQVSHSVTLHCM